jgi:drug/metabolite transporter (DMT)-like permease
MNVLLTPLSLIPALFVWRWPSAEVWAMMVGIGLLAALSHLLMTRAYKIADASAVLPFDYTRLPFIALLAFLFYGEIPDGWTWVGAAIIAASTFYIARREAVVSRERREALRAAGKAPEAGHP